MSSQLSVRILFAGGGTGGHLYPAIAIANKLSSLLKDNAKVDIAFVGTKRGLEYRIKDELGYPLHLINMRGITRSLALINLFIPFIIVFALLQSMVLLKKFQPDLVVGTGGYVSWPVLKMAATLGIITVLQEQNSFPGMATRSASKKAKRIYLGFEDAKNYLDNSGNTMVTGNPVRTDIGSGSKEKVIQQYKLDANKKTILVLGGSQGARAVNNAVIKSLESKRWAGDAQLLWQTGKRDYKDVTEKVKQLHWDGAFFPFANNMPDIYAAADIVIARAGASTLAEIVACGLPSILIPYPYAAGDHQRKNAMSMSLPGAAIMHNEKNLNKTDILEDAVQLMRSEVFEKIKQVLSNMNSGHKPAVDRIAEDIINLIKETKQVGSGS